VKRVNVWVSLLFLSFVLFFTSSCTNVPILPVFTIHMTLEQIKEGAFTGGQLIYSENSLINHLSPGVLIPILDSTYGWTQVENTEEFVYEKLSTIYAYCYVINVTGEEVEFDYLAYDEIGNILFHLEKVKLPVYSPDDSSQPSRAGHQPGSQAPASLKGMEYAKIPSTDRMIHSALNGSSSRALQGARLLSFPFEKPDTSEQMMFRGDETNQVVLFRIQSSAQSPFEYNGGVVAASNEAFPNLIINTAFLTEWEDPWEDEEVWDWEEGDWEDAGIDDWEEEETDYVALIRSKNLPEISVGDYLLDSFSNRTGEVTQIEEYPDEGFNRYYIEEIPINDALGAVYISVIGDIAQIVQRHGSDEDRQWVANLLAERADVTLMDVQWKIPLYEATETIGSMKIFLENNVKLGIDLGLNFEASWSVLSSKGHFYISLEAGMLLRAKGNIAAVFKGKKKLFNPSVKFSIGPIPLAIQCPVNAVSKLTLPALKIDMSAGPVVKTRLGFSYDIGAKLKFKWGWLPYPDIWSDVTGVAEFDPDFIVNLPAENPITLGHAKYAAGLSFSPGLKVVETLSLSLDIPVLLEMKLDITSLTKNLTLDFHCSGEVTLELEAPFLGSKEFSLGELWDKKIRLFTVNLEDLLPDQHEKWSYESNAAIECSPALTIDGEVLFQSQSGNVYCVASDGKKKWEYGTGESNGNSPVLDQNGNVFISGGNKMVSLKKTDQSVNWSYNASGKISSTVALGESDLYFGTQDGFLVCLNSSNGSEQWTRNLSQPIGKALAIAQDGTIYVPSGNMLTAYRQDGMKRWEYATGGSVHSAPAIARDGTVYIGSDDKHVHAISTSGIKKWSFPTGGEVYSGIAVANDGTIYFTSRDKRLYAVDATGKKRWEFLAGGECDSTPLIGSDETVYFGSKEGTLFAINPSNGSKKWSYPKIGKVGALNSNPAMSSDGTLFIGSSDKKLYAIRTESIGLSNSPWPKYGLNNQNSSGLIYIPSDLRIEKHLIGKVLEVGQNAVFVVEADGGTPPYRYRWKKTGQYLPDIEGATLSLSNLTIDDEGEYWVEIYDNANPTPKKITSHKAYLEVNSKEISEKRWSAQIGGAGVGPLVSSPLIDSGYGTVLIVNRSGIVHSLYQNDGSCRWSTMVQSGKGTYNTLAMGKSDTGKDRVYYTSDDGYLRALDLGGGWIDNHWNAQLPSFKNLRASPAISHNNTLIVAASDYGLVSFDNHRGLKLWENRGNREYFSSPAIASDGTIYFGGSDSASGKGVFQAVFPDGATKWRILLPARIDSSPAIGADGTVYFGSNDGSLYAYRPDGTEKWKFTADSRIISGAVVSENGLVYVGTFLGTLYALKADGSIQWTFNTGSAITSTPAIGNDHSMYLGTMGGDFFSLDKNTGEKKWVFSIKKVSSSENTAIESSPAIGNGIVYFGAYNGKLYAVNCTSSGLESGPWPKFRHDNWNSGRQP